MAPTPTTDAPALTPAQIKAQLWADARRQVHAVAMSARIPDLAQRLAAADVIDYDCLLPGVLSAEEQRRAPYMIQLAEQSAFTDWLLFEAVAGLGEWGVVVLSDAQRLPLRAHLRSLRQATLPDGQRIDLDWMDPAVLDVLLPLFDAAGLLTFMGPMQAFVIPRPDDWSTFEISAGQLQRHRARLAAAS
jgi:hypothetical protein